MFMWILYFTDLRVFMFLMQFLFLAFFGVLMCLPSVVYVVVFVFSCSHHCICCVFLVFWFFWLFWAVQPLCFYFFNVFRFAGGIVRQTFPRECCVVYVALGQETLPAQLSGIHQGHARAGAGVTSIRSSCSACDTPLEPASSHLAEVVPDIEWLPLGGYILLRLPQYWNRIMCEICIKTCNQKTKHYVHSLSAIGPAPQPDRVTYTYISILFFGSVFSWLICF